MPSLGELFISLGFDVDDTKLKSFKSSLEDTQEAMAKLGRVAAEGIGGITAAASGIALFVQSGADYSRGLSNMALMYGAATDAAQKFGYTLHALDPLISSPAAINAFAKFSEVVKGLVPLGAQQGNAISILGGYQGENSFLGTSAEAVIAHLASNYPEAKKRFGAAYASKLMQAGLPAESELLIAAQSENPNIQDASEKYIQSAANIAALNKYGAATAELDNAWMKFTTDMKADIAPHMDEAVKMLIGTLNAIDAFNNAHPGAGTVETIGSTIAGFIGGKALWGKIFGTGATVAEGGGVLATGLGMLLAGLTGGFAVGGVKSLYDPNYKSWASQGAQGVSDWIMGDYNPKSDSGYWSKLSPADQKAAMYWISHVEDKSLDPAAFNSAGGGRGAKGIGQWRGKRQDSFQNIHGHDLLQGTLQEQQDFLAYELMTTHRQALEKMHEESSLQGKANAFGKYYEKGDHGPVTINVHSNATDNKEVAHLVAQHFQRVTNVANAQTNTGGY